MVLQQPSNAAPQQNTTEHKFVVKIILHAATPPLSVCLCVPVLMKNRFEEKISGQQNLDEVERQRVCLSERADVQISNIIMRFFVQF